MKILAMLAFCVGLALGECAQPRPLVEGKALPPPTPSV